jgi:hypothetical protein
MEGWEVPVDFIAGRQMGESVIEEGVVFRRGEGFDVAEGLAERSTEGGGRTQQCGQAGTELFVGNLGAKESGGFRSEATFHVFQEALQQVALDAGEELRVGEELKLTHKILGRRKSKRDRGRGQKGCDRKDRD